MLAGRPGDDGETVLRYPAAATGPQVSIRPGPRWPAGRDQFLGRQHRGSAAQLRPPGPDPGSGHPGRRPAAAPAGRGRRRGRGDLAARTPPRARCWCSGPRWSAPAQCRGAVLALDRRHQRGDAAGGLGAPAGRCGVLERPPGAGDPDRLRQPGQPRPAQRPARRAAARAGQLEIRHREPGSRAQASTTAAWTVASKTTSDSATPVPAGQPVLFMDDYGFHYGDVWYRGSLVRHARRHVGEPLNYQTGQVGMLMAWLDGQFLGATGRCRPQRPASPPRRAGRPRCRCRSRRPAQDDGAARAGRARPADGASARTAAPTTRTRRPAGSPPSRSPARPRQRHLAHPGQLGGEARPTRCAAR